MKHALWMVALATFLSACGEKPQTLGAGKQDSEPYVGISKAFADPGWKQRDKACWESHLKARMQQGQNDYSRMN